MTEISLPWLISLIMSADRANRPHGPNLGSIQALFDREISSLNWIFGAIAGATVTLSGAMLGALLAALDSPTGKTIATQDGNVTTTVFVERSGEFGWEQAVLLAFLLTLLLTGLVALIVNRILHVQLRRGYASTVQLYYLLHRITP